jgi:putative flippase GtrA
MLSSLLNSENNQYLGLESLILKFLKFCVVGFSGLILDFGITWLLKERVRTNRYFANSAGFLVAVVCNYAMNRIWTFASNDPQVTVQFIKFLGIAMIGLGLNNGIILLLERKNINFYVAKLIAIGIVVAWNFIMNYRFAFNS